MNYFKFVLSLAYTVTSWRRAYQTTDRLFFLLYHWYYDIVIEEDAGHEL